MPIAAELVSCYERPRTPMGRRHRGAQPPPQGAHSPRAMRARGAGSRISDLVDALEHLAPVAAAEPWDNVGLLVGDLRRPLARVLLTVDYTTAVAREAARGRCEAVVAYHPPLFVPLKRLTAPSVLLDAARRDIALYALHTAFDVAPGGTNDALADALGLTNRRPLRPRSPSRAEGMGRIGRVPPTPRARLLARLRRSLGLGRLLVAGPREGEVRHIAVCAGAGGEFLEDVLAAGAEVYVTGELRHHDALRAAAAGVTVVCTLHSNSERAALRRVRDHLAAALPNVVVRLSEADHDPFTIVG